MPTSLPHSLQQRQYGRECQTGLNMFEHRSCLLKVACVASMSALPIVLNFAALPYGSVWTAM